MHTLGVNLRITPSDRDFCRKKFIEEVTRLKVLLQNREPELIQGCVQKLMALVDFFELEGAGELLKPLKDPENQAIPQMLDTVKKLEKKFLDNAEKAAAESSSESHGKEASESFLETPSNAAQESDLGSLVETASKSSIESDSEAKTETPAESAQESDSKSRTETPSKSDHESDSKPLIENTAEFAQESDSKSKAETPSKSAPESDSESPAEIAPSLF